MSKLHTNLQKVLRSTKVYNEKAIDMNNELNINVDEQHVDIKHLK